MNKKQIASKIGEKMDITKLKAEKILDLFFDIVAEALTKSEKVRLVGFGNFVIRTRAGRIGRNPQTGEKITISSTKLPAFVPSLKLKKQIREKQK